MCHLRAGAGGLASGSPSRVDRHCHWACRTNKGLRTFKQRATMKKPLMKKPWGAWVGGRLGATGVSLVRDRARVRVTTRRSIPVVPPEFHRLKMARATMNTFTLPSPRRLCSAADQPCAWRRRWWWWRRRLVLEQLFSLGTNLAHRGGRWWWWWRRRRRCWWWCVDDHVAPFKI